MNLKELTVTLFEKKTHIQLDGKSVALVGEREFQFADLDGHGMFTVIVEGRSHRIYIKKVDDHMFDMWFGPYCVRAEVEDVRSRLSKFIGAEVASREGVDVTRAPMPGFITKIMIKIGDKVLQGDRLLVLEAMKMENEITSKHAGQIKSILVHERSTVEKGQELIIIETNPGKG